MEKYCKAALATLYLLQVVIVFREPLANAFGLARAAWDGHMARSEDQARDGGFLVLIRRALDRQDNRTSAFMAADQPIREPDSRVRSHEDTNEAHPTEHKDRIRKSRRPFVRGYFIANLYPRFRVFRAVAEAEPSRPTLNFRAIKFSAVA